MTAKASQEGDKVLSAKHMELVGEDYVICERCGNEYNYGEVEIPENATFYWVPSCPDCGAKMTCNPVIQFGLELAGDRLDSSNEDYEEHRRRLHSRSRLYHGRLSGYSVEELVRRAKWFDRRATKGYPFGPRFYRGIAFRLRQQARSVLR